MQFSSQGKESCLLNMVVLISQSENSNVDDTVKSLNSQKDKINLKTERILEIKLDHVSQGSVALCVDIPVEKIETDEMLHFVLYWFIQIILQTGVVHLSSTENLDVALILSEGLYCLIIVSYVLYRYLLFIYFCNFFLANYIN